MTDHRIIHAEEAEVDDVIVVEASGNLIRQGRIIEIHGDGERRFFDVVWSDTQRSYFYPDPMHVEVLRRPITGRRRYP